MYEVLVDQADDVPQGKKREADRYSGLNDEALLDALRAENTGAFLEIVKRYQGLVYRYASQLGVQSEEQHEWTTDLMTDVVLSLLKPGAILPSSLGSYIARACRNKAYMAHRTRSRRDRRENEASVLGLSDERVVESVCSEDMLRSAKGVDVDQTETSPLLKRFVHELSAGLTDDEREMLDWTSDAVPLRLMAEWQGITRDAAAHRISRLRRRLKKLAPAIIDRFDNSDRDAIRKLFRGGLIDE